MTDPEKFVNVVNGQPTTLTNLTGSNFGASGASHSVGLVPDPGSSAGTTKFLREDGSWQTISTSSVLPTPTRAGDIIYWNGSAWVTLAGNNSGTQFLQETSAGAPSWATPSVTAPTYQSFTSSSGNYTPTSGSVLRIKVRMCGGGGGGAAAGANSGANGTDTSFDSWTAIHGVGGTVNTIAGTGGTGGVNGTGTLIVRFDGGAGGPLSSNANFGGGGMGGTNPFGGGGSGGSHTNNGGNGAPNTGAGGGGGASISVGNTGGGAGEYVEFVVPVPGTIAYVVGSGGNGGAAGNQAGGNGASGIILIEEMYI